MIRQASFRHRGFTLLEILLALFLLAVVVSTVFGAYTGVLRISEETLWRAEVQTMARTALGQMTTDLESSWVSSEAPKKDNASGERDLNILFLGEEQEVWGQPFDRLRFYSMARADFGEGVPGPRPVEIAYWVERTGNGEAFTLMRSEGLTLGEPREEGPRGFPLCEGLSLMRITYYDVEGQAHANWHAGDRETGRLLPVRVSISLTFPNPHNPEAPFQFLTGVRLPLGQAGGVKS